MTLVPRIFRGTVWITNNREHLNPLTDMKPSHIENTIKFIQKPARLVHIQNMYLHEFLSLPSPNGEMAEMAYDESIRELYNIFDDLTPKQYFEEHIKPSPLFQQLLKAYFQHTKTTIMPEPFLSKEDLLWYETGHHPADSFLQKGKLN